MRSLIRYILFFFSSRRRHTRCALVTGVQTCALPISVMSDAKYDFDGFLDYIQGGVRVAKRKAGFEQYLGGPPAPGGSFVTPLDAAGLPSDILSQAPGVPQMNGGASFLQLDPDYLVQESIKRQLRTL